MGIVYPSESFSVVGIQSNLIEPYLCGDAQPPAKPYQYKPEDQYQIVNENGYKLVFRKPNLLDVLTNFIIKVLELDNPIAIKYGYLPDLLADGLIGLQIAYKDGLHLTPNQVELIVKALKELLTSDKNKLVDEFMEWTKKYIGRLGVSFSKDVVSEIVDAIQKEFEPYTKDKKVFNKFITDITKALVNFAKVYEGVRDKLSKPNYIASKYLNDDMYASSFTYKMYDLDVARKQFWKGYPQLKDNLVIDLVFDGKLFGVGSIPNIKNYIIALTILNNYNKAKYEVVGGINWSLLPKSPKTIIDQIVNKLDTIYFLENVDKLVNDIIQFFTKFGKDTPNLANNKNKNFFLRLKEKGFDFSVVEQHPDVAYQKLYEPYWNEIYSLIENTTKVFLYQGTPTPRIGQGNGLNLSELNETNYGIWTIFPNFVFGNGIIYDIKSKLGVSKQLSTIDEIISLLKGDERWKEYMTPNHRAYLLIRTPLTNKLHKAIAEEILTIYLGHKLGVISDNQYNLLFGSKLDFILSVGNISTFLAHNLVGWVYNPQLQKLRNVNDSRMVFENLLADLVGRNIQQFLKPIAELEKLEVNSIPKDVIANAVYKVLEIFDPQSKDYAEITLFDFNKKLPAPTYAVGFQLLHGNTSYLTPYTYNLSLNLAGLKDKTLKQSINTFNLLVMNLLS